MIDALALPSSPAPLAPTAGQDLAAAWAEALTDWLATRRSDRTRRAYAEALRGLLTHAGKETWAVTRADVASWAKSLEADGLGDASRALALAAVASFYKHAKDEGLIGRNPVDGVPRPKVEAYGRAVALKKSQAERVLSAISRDDVAGRRDFAMMTLALGVALRRAELVNIKRGDLAETVTGKVTLTYRIKGGDTITRPLPSLAVAALREYLADRGPLAAEDPVFVAHDRATGHRPPHALTAEAWRLIVAKYTRAALGQSVSVHTLRHTAATEAWEQTRDLKQVQALLGHKNVTTTQRYIDHLQDNRDALGDDLLAAFGVA